MRSNNIILVSGGEKESHPSTNNNVLLDNKPANNTNEYSSNRNNSITKGMLIYTYHTCTTYVWHLFINAIYLVEEEDTSNEDAARNEILRFISELRAGKLIKSKQAKLLEGLLFENRFKNFD